MLITVKDDYRLHAAPDEILEGDVIPTERGPRRVIAMRYVGNQCFLVVVPVDSPFVDADAFLRNEDGAHHSQKLPTDPGYWFGSELP